MGLRMLKLWLFLMKWSKLMGSRFITPWILDFDTVENERMEVGLLI